MVEKGTLKELAAKLLGQRPEDLLDYSLSPEGVTLIGRDGRKVRVRWQQLVGWKVVEGGGDGRPETGDGGPGTGDGGPETGDGGPGTGDGGRKTGGRGRKKGGKR